MKVLLLLSSINFKVLYFYFILYLKIYDIYIIKFFLKMLQDEMMHHYYWHPYAQYNLKHPKNIIF